MEHKKLTVVSEDGEDIISHMRERIAALESEFAHQGRVAKLERWRVWLTGFAASWLMTGGLLMWLAQKVLERFPK